MTRVADTRPAWGGVLAWICLWAASVLPVLSQVRIEGEVLDKRTRMPVAGAIVHFPDLGIGTISDSMGYFVLESLPRGSLVLAVHRTGYLELEEEVRVVQGDIWDVVLTPSAIPIPGVLVEGPTGSEVEASRTGRRTDYLAPSTVAQAAVRTNMLLEVLRSKAPPRLRIRQEGGVGGISFCMESSRRRPSIHEMMDAGVGCRPVLLAVDGVVVYAPPASGVGGVPSDVAALLLGQDPKEIRSVLVLSPADAFFRYGEAGRSGAVEILTLHPGRPGS